jgi:hypothetical protein
MLNGWWMLNSFGILAFSTWHSAFAIDASTVQPLILQHLQRVGEFRAAHLQCDDVGSITPTGAR